MFRGPQITSTAMGTATASSVTNSSNVNQAATSVNKMIDPCLPFIKGA
jgi:hypothetical protein